MFLLGSSPFFDGARASHSLIRTLFSDVEPTREKIVCLSLWYLCCVYTVFICLFSLLLRIVVVVVAIAYYSN